MTHSSADLRGRTLSQRVGERRIPVLVSALCTLPALLSVLQGYVSGKLSGRMTSWRDLVFSGADWLLVGVLAIIPYRLGRSVPIRGPRWKGNLAVNVLGAIGFAVAWASLGMVLGLILQTYPAENPLLRSYLNWSLITIPFAMIVYFGVIGCAYAYEYFVEAREREAEAFELAAQLAEARLGALRMQLNPHFLFNSLNSALVLVRERDERSASQVLELLSELPRELLQPNRPREVTLAAEVGFLERYLSVEQIRFPDRLRVDYAIEDRARSALVPDLLLQPIVENAIRHGITKKAEGGTLSISAKVEGHSVVLCVSDNGLGMHASDSEVAGLGLSNTRTSSHYVW